MPAFGPRGSNGFSSGCPACNKLKMPKPMVAMATANNTLHRMLRNVFTFNPGFFIFIFTNNQEYKIGESRN
jgi:hypothetical protein